MNLLCTQYVHDKQRLEIYLAGCKGEGGQHCAGCHNPQSWDFNAGEELSVKKLLEKAYSDLVKNIWILGGEPLDQPIIELNVFLSLLSAVEKSLWLFTRFEIHQVENNTKQYLDYIKTGKYDVKQACEGNIREGVKLATANQKLWKKINNVWVEVSNEKV